MRLWTTLVFAATALVAMTSGPLSAQDYPNRVITIIVPYPAGGPTDATARVLAAGLAVRLGQQAVVENVSGAGSTLGMQRVARAAPDGHTLLLHNMAFSSAIALFPNVKLDPIADFTPVGLVNSNGNVIIGRSNLPANNLQELVAWMKSGVAVKFAHPGVGNMGHLCAALFNQAVGAANVDYIPYRGGAPATQDVVAGHADLFCSTTQLVVQPIQSGQVKGFGITAKEEIPQLPNVPSLVKAYGPKLEITYWHALIAPAGTPRPIVDKLNAAMREIVADPKIAKGWTDTGILVFPPDQQTPEAAATLVKSEIKRWGDVIRDNKIEAPAQ